MSFIWEDAPTQERWVANAVSYYQKFYTFQEILSEEEWTDICKMREWCAQHLPEPYKAGVQLLAKNAAYLGEDIYVVDGQIQHPMHVPCPACRKHGLVFRADQKSWCVL